MKTFTANDQPGFKLQVSISDCAAPKDIKHLVFTGEQYDDQGNKIQESSYEFFLTSEQIVNLGEQLRSLS